MLHTSKCWLWEWCQITGWPCWEFLTLTRRYEEKQSSIAIQILYHFHLCVKVNWVQSIMQGTAYVPWLAVWWGVSVQPCMSPYSHGFMAPPAGNHCDWCDVTSAVKGKATTYRRDENTLDYVIRLSLQGEAWEKIWRDGCQGRRLSKIGEPSVATLLI